MRMIGVVACNALVIVSTLLVPASARVSDFTTIDVPGASFTLPRGINSAGDIVGSYSAGGTTHGYMLDKEGSLTTIDVPGASATEALSINPQGHIVGQYSAGGTNHGFLAQ